MIVPSKNMISAYAEHLRNGVLVAFPTETVYGLGAHALRADAVSRVFAIKGRPTNNPLIVHVADFESLLSLSANLLPQQRKVIERLFSLKLLPGPLSLVLPASEQIPREVTGGGSSVAIRIPSHPIAQEFLKTCAVPVAAPSANRSNRVSPTTADHVRAEFGDQVPYIIDGGPSVVGIESTVLSLLYHAPTVLRHGSVTVEMLQEALPNTEIRSRDHRWDESALPSPGLLSRHYCPRTPLVFSDSKRSILQSDRVAHVTFSPQESSETTYCKNFPLSTTGDLGEAAQMLYKVLRQIDLEDFDLIVADRCEPLGIGRAIMDRLSRAAEKD